MSISIDSGSLYNATSSATQASTKTNLLKTSLEGNLNNATDEELMDACKGFETYLLEQLFKGMRDTVPKDEEENEYVDYFGDKLYEQYATDATAKGDIGLAQMLYESMKRK